MFNLSNIGPRPGARRLRKRVGRGAASGWGKTSGKGTKGQKARTSPGMPRGFEGGQMPLYRRLPKRGFKAPFSKEYAIVNLSTLKDVPAGTLVTAEYLLKHGHIAKKLGNGVKVLGNGEIAKALRFQVAKVSKVAQQKIEAAGGSVELV